MGKHSAAVVVGASSGIGEAVARRLHKDGWPVVLMGRRQAELVSIADSLGERASVVTVDLVDVEPSKETLRQVFSDHEVGLVVISSGVGDENPELDPAIEDVSLAVNVVGFTNVAGIAFRSFAAGSGGHIVGITSIAALRGDGLAASYSATKSYQSVYLDGLRSLARKQPVKIVVTDIQPGFVDTPMMKSEKPFWMASADKAANQIVAAIDKERAHAYVTKRWALIAFVLKRLPRPR